MQKIKILVSAALLLGLTGCFESEQKQASSTPASEKPASSAPAPKQDMAPAPKQAPAQSAPATGASSGIRSEPVHSTQNAAAAAQGAPISRGNMPAYCRGEAAGMYGTRPQYVQTGEIVEDKDGSYSIGGTVDKGNEGIKKFKCRFDRSRNFIDVMALTSDGKL